MSGRLKLKSIYPTFEEFSTFCMDTITEFYPRLVTDMPNSTALKSEIERYVFKPLYRQFKNATCRYLPTEEGIDAFNNQFSNQLEEVVFDFLVYTSTNLHYFNESYTKVGENLEQGVTTYNSPINQDITNTKSNTTIAKGATAQNINLMVYNGNTSWLKAFSSYYTPQRKAELIDRFRWLFISFYVGSDEGVILVELSKALSMADGDMVITPEENEILRKVIIEKPDTLIPENIRDGVNIGGVDGSLEQGVIPSGILEITENGLYNVADKEGVNVNVGGVTVKDLFDAKKSCNYEFAQATELTSEQLASLLVYEDTSNVTDMSYMFNNCINLVTIPQLDTSNVLNMSNMFNLCTNLITIPQLNTSKVTSMSSMFNTCNKLETVPQLDTSNVTTFARMFYRCYNLTTILMTGMKINFDISASNNFTREALVTILNNLGTVTTTRTLTMGATNLAKLTNEDKDIATNKGWTLA